MLNKLVKSFGVVLFGLILLAFTPSSGYAYYNASVSTGSVTNITQTNATFNGSVNTGGIQGNAWFEYGTDSSFGNTTTLNAFNFNAPYSGSFSTNISGLSANTTYYVRAVGQNSAGQVYGNITSFTTSFSNSENNNSMSPTATTTSGSVLSNSILQMNALILTNNSNSADTWFEWGTTSNLGNKTVVMPVSGAPAIRHTNTLAGLLPGTRYYFRAVAQNSYGISYGDILSLMTTGSAQTYNNNQNNTNTYVVPANTAPTNTVTSTETTSADNGNLSGNALGANIFGYGGFLPTNLFGWLIIIVLILLIVYLSRRLYGQASDQRSHS